MTSQSAAANPDLDDIVPPTEPTPGPWRAYELPHVANAHHTYWHIEGGSGRFGDDGHGFSLSGFISPSNARLLAAASTLLAILKAAAEDDVVQWHDGSLLKAAREAIAKAEGRR